MNPLSQLPSVDRLLSAAPLAALVLVKDRGTARLIRATRCDEPGLEVLSPSDRAKVAAAVATLHREAQEASADGS